MIWIYIAALIFGGAFLVPMLLGGLELDSEVDLDLDSDVDLDLDADADGGLIGSGTGAVGDIVAGLLSFRSLVFFSTFFGLGGIVFTTFGYGAVATFVTVVVLGVVAAVAHSAVFGFVQRSGTTSQISNHDLEGRPARVVLPLADQRKGRIRVDLSGQPHYLVALPFQRDSVHRFDVGDSVVVVEIENGTALVAPLELDLGKEH